MPTHTTHPFMEYYNVGLNSSGPYRSISVSINTDDSDVFGTSFKWESSLVAAALEKEYKKGNSDVLPRVINDRLDKIRRMAFEQRFDIER